MQLTTIGLDIAKQVFHVVGLSSHHLVLRKKLRRKQVLDYFARLPVCLVALEACATSHYWGRELEKLGHTIRLIPPKAVKPYVRGNKNDFNDALAIAEAASRPDLRFVSVKTVEDQDRQALHRLREGCHRQRTRLCNQLRSLLAEYGIIAPKGVSKLRQLIADSLEDGENGLSGRFRQLLQQGYQQLQEVEAHIAAYDRQLQEEVKSCEAAQRLMTIPGYGPVNSSLFLSVVGDGKAYRRGRDVSAAIGIVPRQHSSGDKQVLLGISKRGNRHLRRVLIHGARSVVSRAHKKEDKLSRWVNELVERKGKNKATVALANKLARIGWAVLTSGGVYQPR